MRIQRFFRLLYSIVAFAGAIILHDIDHGFTVFAQQEYQSARQYERGAGWDRHDEKDKELDDHLTATDNRVNGLSEKVSMMSGIGVTVCAGLGILNLLGFIRPHPGGGEPPGKTHFVTPE